MDTKTINEELKRIAVEANALRDEQRRLPGALDAAVRVPGSGEEIGRLKRRGEEIDAHLLDLQMSELGLVITQKEAELATATAAAKAAADALSATSAKFEESRRQFWAAEQEFRLKQGQVMTLNFQPSLLAAEIRETKAKLEKLVAAKLEE